MSIVNGMYLHYWYVYKRDRGYWITRYPPLGAKKLTRHLTYKGAFAYAMEQNRQQDIRDHTGKIVGVSPLDLFG